jgi:hypothetical protein
LAKVGPVPVGRPENQVWEPFSGPKRWFLPAARGKNLKKGNFNDYGLGGGLVFFKKNLFRDYFGPLKGFFIF